MTNIPKHWPMPIIELTNIMYTTSKSSNWRQSRVKLLHTTKLRPDIVSYQQELNQHQQHQPDGDEMVVERGRESIVQTEPGKPVVQTEVQNPLEWDTTPTSGTRPTGSTKTLPSGADETKETQVKIVCYNCNRDGHVSPDCTFTIKTDGLPINKRKRNAYRRYKMIGRLLEKVLLQGQPDNIS